MREIKVMFLLLFAFTLLLSASAQDDTGYTSTVNWFYSACEDRMVIDLSGTLESGYDLYFQAFDAYGGLGNPLTGLRQVEVHGDYAVSQVVYWLNGVTRSAGEPVSVVIRIGSENDPDTTLFQAPSDDTQGECEAPANALTQGNLAQSTLQVVASSGVYTPDGDFLNPVYSRPSEPIVMIGARPTDDSVPGRTENPGLIYAECEDVPGAEPGVIYDTDTIRVFWSWFAQTPEQVQMHIDTVQYAILLNGQPFEQVERVGPMQVPGSGDYWVFYRVNLGPNWLPGIYELNYALGWSTAITDGYDEYGPGTANERLGSRCVFKIDRNPHGIQVHYDQPANPYLTFPWGS